MLELSSSGFYSFFVAVAGFPCCFCLLSTVVVRGMDGPISLATMAREREREWARRHVLCERDAHASEPANALQYGMVPGTAPGTRYGVLATQSYCLQHSYNRRRIAEVEVGNRRRSM